MKKLFLAIALCMGIAAAMPQQASAAGPNVTMLPSGYDRYVWVNEDGSRTIAYADAEGNVLQFMIIDADNKVTFMWP